jgi:hypothetical protein
MASWVPGREMPSADPLAGEKMGKQKREQSLNSARTREELAQHFMRLRLQEAERRAQEYLSTLDPRESSHPR